MKLLRPFTGTGAVFFPVGKPPVGTCEFATPRCLRLCYAGNPLYPEFDEEIRIPEYEKRFIYESFIRMEVGALCSQLNYELDGLQTPILHWFGSGDCITEDIEHVSMIMNYIQKNYKNIVQMGFTRNETLWEKHKDILALTIESIKAIGNRNGIFSVPDYKKETSVMYAAGYEVKGGRCGSVTCRDRLRRELEHYINCKTCMRLKMGCFDRRKESEPKGAGGERNSLISEKSNSEPALNEGGGRV